MANVDRVKRQLLRDLVQENVDLAEGRLPRSLRKGRYWPLTLRLFAVALLSVALLGSSRLITSLTPAPGPAAAARPPRPLAEAAAAGPAPLLTGVPQPVDAAVFPLAVRKVVI